MAEPRRRSRTRAVLPGVVIALTLASVGVALGIATRQAFFLINFLYIGASIGGSMALYSILSPRRRQRARRLAQFLVGGYMLGLLGLLARENMQLEGFFFTLFAGVFTGAVIHYVVAKIAGPLVFGRAWCGWSCWTAMVLDLLPFTRDRAGRLPGRYALIPYAHFGASFALVIVLVSNGVRQGSASLTWLVVGNLLYYVVGIGLAFALQDNRAFCKYVCPVPVLQKLTSRFALMKLAGDPAKCDSCGACEAICPMDIRLTDHIFGGRRIAGTECVLCLACVNACAKDALRVSLAGDAVWRDALRVRVRTPSG